ncbi:MAG: hypothetical protein V1922_00330 [bacterium]
MKVKIIAVLLFVVSVLIIAQKTSFAQGIVPSGFPQPGVTCGVPNGAGDLMKCCKSPIVKPGDIDLGNVALNGAYFLLKPLIEKYTNPIMQKQKSVEIKPCAEGVPSKPGDINNPDCICLIDQAKEPLTAFESICQHIKSPTEQSQCLDCVHNKSGAWTALGCFNGNVSEFITNNIMKTGIGIAGGISLLCIMFAAFQMQTSAGNAEKVKKAQELMTNCITGLMVILFSILILKIIGVDILKIPGFN